MFHSYKQFWCGGAVLCGLLLLLRAGDHRGHDPGSAISGERAIIYSRYDYFDQTGDTMILFGLTLSAVSVMQLMIAEKRTGTLKNMRIVGLRESVYWLSW